MREAQSVIVYSLSEALDDLYRQFGFWKISRALVAASMRNGWAENQLAHLTNHLRRDIGVPEVVDSDEVRALQLCRFP